MAGLWQIHIRRASPFDVNLSLASQLWAGLPGCDRYDMADLADAHGRPELADQWLTVRAREGDATQALYSGRRLLNDGVGLEIWSQELIDALPQQRTAFGAVALLSLAALIGFLQTLIRRNAIRKLERRARPRPSSSAASRPGRRWRLVLRIGKSMYLSYGRSATDCDEPSTR